MIMSLIVGDREPVSRALQLPLLQLPLCCPCGSPELYRRGLCEFCYNRGRRSRARYGGGRERVLARDRHLCRVCLATRPLVVHHRSL